MDIKTNIALIGMPAVGKSTIGVVAAKLLGKQFVDTDLLIQRARRQLLGEIIESDGICGLLKAEEKTLVGLDETNSIIATGGSAVYSETGMKRLKQIAIVVYLKADFATIQGRLKETKNRGVVIKNGQTMRELYDERCPLYERYADIIIDVDGKSLEDVAQMLVNNVKSM